MKSISKINPPITENTEYLIIKVHAPFIDLKVDVLLDHGVSLRFRFTSGSSNMLGNILSKE